VQKLLRGIVDFRKNSLTRYREKFSRLVYGQSPDTLLIACCDSRVAPNVFASTNPGDLFVVRNIGNLVCPCHSHDSSGSDDSTAAAIEFALNGLKVKDIIICGHAECAAMNAMLNGREKLEQKYLRSWLRYADPSYEKFKSGFKINPNLSPCNQLSQINVLQQLEHLKTYSIVQKHLCDGSLRIHGWWFDLATGDVYHYKNDSKKFVILDDKELEKLLINFFNQVPEQEIDYDQPCQ
jgi:carbonic anhydrase